MTLIDVRGIEHSYGTVPVLDDVSFGVRSETVTAIIGPNGSGKTTLLRLLAGLHEPTGGSIDDHTSDGVRRIGYLPQQPAFRPGFSVHETLSFYTSLVGADDDEVIARLERVGLEQAVNLRVDDLSGGMTRLLGIAQATVGDPPLIVLDEPVSGLDPQMSLHVFDVISEIAADGTTVVLSSHHLELVERTADDVVLIDDGEVVAHGSPDELRDELGVESLLEVYEGAVTGSADAVRVRGEHA